MFRSRVPKPYFPAPRPFKTGRGRVARQCFKRLSFDSSGPGALSPKPYFPVPRPLGCNFKDIWTDTDRCGSSFSSNRRFWTQNNDIYANYAYWGGGTLALSSGYCQELRPKVGLLLEIARECLLKDLLLKCQKTVFQKTIPRRLD